MTAPFPIDPAEFVVLVKPLLQAQDLEGLMCLLKARWSAQQISSLLVSNCCDVRNVAALSLALVGDKSCIPALARRLRDADVTANQMAEHALWSIWFRSGNSEANLHLARGALAIDQRDYQKAISHLNRAAQVCPDLAEAYNQRAIAHYLLEHYEECLADCRRTVRLMPCHFGAWSGMGHCHAHLGHLADAVECYRKALVVNPHLSCIREAIQELEQRLNLR